LWAVLSKHFFNSLLSEQNCTGSLDCWAGFSKQKNLFVN